MGRPHRTAMLLNAEISAVVTAMRQNAKWALVPMRYTDDEIGDDPLLEDFRLLRRRLFKLHDWRKVNPMEYLAPFLEVIRSHETSGPITGVALTSVRRMLDQNILVDADVGQPEAMAEIAEAVTQCKFEATDRESDEVVLYKILQVLLSCVRCPMGELLTNGSVIDIFQACFRIGHYQTEKSKGMTELLTQASRLVMLDVVRIIFGRLPDLPPSVPPPESAALHPLRSGAPHIVAGSLTLERSSPTQHAPDAAQLLADGLATELPGPDGGTEAVLGRESSTVVEAAEEQAAAGAEAADSVGLDTNAAAEVAAAASPERHHTVSVAPLSPARPKDEPESAGHGLESITEMLGQLVSLIALDVVGTHTDVDEFGLDLMNAALSAGGSAFASHEVLMAILREDLFVAFFSAVRSPNLACLSGVCQVAFSLYAHLGAQLLLQLEAFIEAVLLKLAEGKGIIRIEQQEAALEGLLDFCNKPSFIRNVYLNLDCRLERGNLFESIAGLLSKTAFPVNTALGSVHLLSLEGLFSILSGLSTGCSGVSGWDGEVSAPAEAEVAAIWEALCESRLPSLLPSEAGGDEYPVDGLSMLAAAARNEKYVKGKLSVAADHFNRDYKKGFQYLQSIGLLRPEPEALPVAHFLRHCPGLSKGAIGELLGEPDDFFLSVLACFTHTFDFTGLDFEVSFRMFLESFRLPGEAQKIARVLEAFGQEYHVQCPHIFYNSDVVYVLSYSVIMLNTDQHNSQVKKKMTSDEFVKNNRGINNGDNLPPEFLRSIYTSISRSEIRITSEAAATPFDVSPLIWAELQRSSTTPRGAILEAPINGAAGVLERDMFSLMWGPTVAAVSVVLDHADNPVIISTALTGLMHAARIAAYFHINEVMDNLMSSLSKYTAMLSPSGGKPVVEFGNNEKARMACHASFQIANRYGDYLGSGWCNILDCVVRMHKLGLLPAGLLRTEAESPEAAAARLPKPPPPSRSGSSGVLYRALTSLISIDGSEAAAPEQSQRDVEAIARTGACVESCRIDEIFADSKFLKEEALLDLAKAILWAAGPVAKTAAAGEDTAIAELCLELLFTMALRNRDRIQVLWPLVHKMLAAIMAPDTARSANPLVVRGALGLLRVAGRLLVYKGAAADGLLASLQLLPRLKTSVAWDLAPAVAAQLLVLLKFSATHIQSASGWSTICQLIGSTSLHPDGTSAAFECLALLSSREVLSLSSFQPCLATALTIMERHSKDPYPERSMKALDVIESQGGWLLRHSHHRQSIRAAAAAAAATENVNGLVPAQSAAAPGAVGDKPAEDSGGAAERQLLAELWLAVLRALGKASAVPNRHLRNHAIQALHGVVMQSEWMELGGALWLQVLAELLVPLTSQLARTVSFQAREYPEAEKTLRLAAHLLIKAMLQYLPELLPQPDFGDCWQRVLQVLQECINSRSEELIEYVPEALKNLLLVMASRGILTEQWLDPSGRSLWALTWSQSREISSGLTPQLLASSGLSLPPRQISAAQAGSRLASTSGTAAASSPPVTAVLLPETSALAAALAAAQQQLAAHELAEHESAVKEGNGDAAELPAKSSPAEGPSDSPTYIGAPKAAIASAATAPPQQAPPRTDGESASAAPRHEDGARQSGNAEQDSAAAEPQPGEEIAKRAVPFSKPEMVSAADVSERDSVPAPDGAPAEQHAEGLEQKQADLREGPDTDEVADAEQAGGTCKQS